RGPWSRSSWAGSSGRRPGWDAATASEGRPRRRGRRRRRAAESRESSRATAGRRQTGTANRVDILVNANTFRHRPSGYRLAPPGSREEEDQHQPEEDAVDREPVHLPRRDEADEDSDRHIADAGADARAAPPLR